VKSLLNSKRLSPVITFDSKSLSFMENVEIKIADMEHLERHGFFVRLIRLFTVPILNTLPSSIIQFFMRKSSHDAATIVAKGGSTHALEAMYTRYHRKLFSWGILQGFADIFWHHIVSQPKAIRNRVKIIASILKDEIRRLVLVEKKRFDTVSVNNNPIQVLTIAGGSARSIVYALHSLVRQQGLNLKVVNVDKDISALRCGEVLVSQYGLSDYFEWIEGNANNLGELVKDRKFDIIEVVGLIDYLSEERAMKLLNSLKTFLKPDGLFVAANVTHNSEVPFVYKTGWPRMFYRSPSDFYGLLQKTGFVLRGPILLDPLKVHLIARATKK